MAKKSKAKLAKYGEAKKDKGNKKRKAPPPARQERRFVSQSATSPMVVRGLGALASIALGAGLWGYFWAKSFTEEAWKPMPSYLIAAGAVLMGITIWFGTSSESPLRVGAPGIAVEKGEVRRMPWWSVQKITFDSSMVALLALGKDETGTAWTIKVPLKSHAEAVGWILKEALDRIPRRVDISDETLDKMPAAHEHAGMKLDLEPLQVVGKRCAATGKTVSYEPDARVCARCERVYLRRAVPKKCKCGNSLLDLRPKDAFPDEEDEGIDEEDPDRIVSSSSSLEAADEVDDDAADVGDDDNKKAKSKAKTEETADT